MSIPVKDNVPNVQVNLAVFQLVRAVAKVLTIKVINTLIVLTAQAIIPVENLELFGE